MSAIATCNSESRSGIISREHERPGGRPAVLRMSLLRITVIILGILSCISILVLLGGSVLLNYRELIKTLADRGARHPLSQP
eukprot:4622763-Pyramimonas_sp.AAC.1